VSVTVTAWAASLLSVSTVIAYVTVPFWLANGPVGATVMLIGMVVPLPTATGAVLPIVCAGIWFTPVTALVRL